MKALAKSFSKKGIFILILFFSVRLGAFTVELRIRELKNASYNFSFSKFIDARPDKMKPVGVTRTGASNREESMHLRENFGKICDSIFSSEKLRYNKARIFIPVINQITIQETHQNGSQSSLVSLAIDYYIQTGDSCQLFFSNFVTREEQSSFDVTSKHGSNLIAAFQGTFRQLELFISSQKPPYSSIKVKLADLPDLLTTNKTMKEVLKDGIYFNCRQIINDLPSPDRDNLLSGLDTSATIEFDKNNSFFKENLFFAFVKDHRLYVHVTGLLYQKATVEADKRRIYYENVTHYSPASSARVSFGVGVMFGFPGIFAGTTTGNPIPGKIVSLGKVYLDLDNGLVSLRP